MEKTKEYWEGFVQAVITYETICGNNAPKDLRYWVKNVNERIHIEFMWVIGFSEVEEQDLTEEAVVFCDALESLEEAYQAIQNVILSSIEDEKSAWKNVIEKRTKPLLKA